MRFKAITSTEDKRLTAGKTYCGQFIVLSKNPFEKFEDYGERCGLRIIVFDNRGDWMTFNPKVFVPAEVCK